MPANVPSPSIVPSDDWMTAHLALLAQEKKLTAAHDALAVDRRRAPWMKVEADYAFNGAEGVCGLHDLFAGRRQLIVYHHMLKPDDPSPCAGCSMVGDQIPHLAHLHARNTSLVFVSHAPFAEIDRFKRRMGWKMPWFESTDSFSADHGVSGGFGLNVFYRRGDEIFRTYFTSGRGVEALGTPWTLLDLTPDGRQEDWEVSPEGTQQTPPYHWWRLHDEY